MELVVNIFIVCFEINKIKKKKSEKLKWCVINYYHGQRVLTPDSVKLLFLSLSSVTNVGHQLVKFITNFMKILF